MVLFSLLNYCLLSLFLVGQFIPQASTERGVGYERIISLSVPQITFKDPLYKKSNTKTLNVEFEM